MAKIDDKKGGNTPKNKDIGDVTKGIRARLPEMDDTRRFSSIIGDDEEWSGLIDSSEPSEKEVTKEKDKSSASKDIEKKENEAQQTTESNSLKGYLRVVKRGTDATPTYAVKLGRNKNMDDIPSSLVEYQTVADETCAVIEALYSENRIKVKKKDDFENAKHKAAVKRNKYINKLIRTSEVALNEGQPTMGKKMLTNLRKEIVIEEGGKIKNKYFRNLGIWALCFALVAGILGMVFRNLNTSPDFPPDEAEEQTTEELIKEDAGMFDDNIVYAYLFVFAGSALGTWISFGFRKRKITFMDLVMMEEDRIKSFPRLLFAGVVSIVMLLFLTSGILNFSIGEIDISEIAYKVNIDHQLILGVIAGLLGDSLVAGIYNTANNLVDFNEKK